MKTPDRRRSGSPPSAENSLRGLYFSVWCYRRPTIGASPTTFLTVSLGRWVNRGQERSSLSCCDGETYLVCVKRAWPLWHLIRSHRLGASPKRPILWGFLRRLLTTPSRRSAQNFPSTRSGE